MFIEANSMAISNVDILSIEPTDARVSASLTKSVQMGIFFFF